MGNWLGERAYRDIPHPLRGWAITTPHNGYFMYENVTDFVRVRVLSINRHPPIYTPVQHG